MPSMKTCLVSSVNLGKRSALIVTLGKGNAYLFSFVEENHFLWYKRWRWEKHKKGGWIVSTFSSSSPIEVTGQKQLEYSFWSDVQILNAADKHTHTHTQRERQSNYTDSFHKLEVVLSPLHFQVEFTKKCNIWLQMLTAKTSKRLQMLKHNCKRLLMLLNTIKRLLCSSTTARDF